MWHTILLCWLSGAVSGTVSGYLTSLWTSRRFRSAMRQAQAEIEELDRKNRELNALPTRNDYKYNHYHDLDAH